MSEYSILAISISRCHIETFLFKITYPPITIIHCNMSPYMSFNFWKNHNISVFRMIVFCVYFIESY